MGGARFCACDGDEKSAVLVVVLLLLLLCAGCVKVRCFLVVKLLMLWRVLYRSACNVWGLGSGI